MPRCIVLHPADNVATLIGTPPTISITQPSPGTGVGQASNLQSLSTVNFVAKDATADENHWFFDVSGAFTSVGFAIAIPKGRSSEAQSKLTRIVSEAKAAGIVQKAIDNAGLKGIRVAPD